MTTLRRLFTYAALASSILANNACTTRAAYTATYYRCESSSFGLRDNKLVPYFSAAVPEDQLHRYPIGTFVYVPQLRGARLPNGKRHRGIFRIDDICAGDGCWQTPDRGSDDDLPVFDIHVGRGGRIGSGAQRVVIKKLVGGGGSHRKTPRYGGRRC